MTRIMYDGVTAANLPTGGQLYAYYVDGIYANGAAVKTRFPSKLYVPITIGHTAAYRGLVLDVEPGDATNAQAVAWCRAYPGSNADLTLYTGQDNFSALQKALTALTTKPNIWVANYDGKAVIPAGCVAKQYRGDVKPGYDQSIVADYWPGVDPDYSEKPTLWRGFKFDPSTITKLALAEQWIGVTLAFSQGSYSSGVAASAGTHDGGGAVDVRCVGDSTSLKVLKVHYLRAVGFAAWHRPYNWDGIGGGEHIHCEEIGNPNLSSGAKSQITQWNNGTNGLAGSPRDTDSIDVAAGRPARITKPPVADVQPKNTPLTLGDGMTIITYPKGDGWKGDFVFNGVVLKHIPSAAAEAALKALGVPTKTLSTANFNALYAAFGG